MPYLILLIALLLPAEVGAAVYLYTDDKGVVCITDRLDSVPEKYRDKCEVVGTGPDSSASPAAASPGRSLKDSVAGGIEKVKKGAAASLSFIPQGGFDDLKTWIALAGFSTVFSSLMLFITIRDKKIRCMVGTMLLASIYLVIGSLYLQRAMDRGGDIVKEAERLKGLASGLGNGIDGTIDAP